MMSSINAADTRQNSQSGPDTMSLLQSVSVAARFIFEKNNRVPDIPLPGRRADLAPFARRAAGEFNATWLGHSSVMLNMDGFRILLDPVFDAKVSPVGPSRFNGALPLDIDRLPRVDLVIISHDHYDHLNKFTIRAIAPKTDRFIVPEGVDRHLGDWGVPPEKITALSWWESSEPVSGLAVTACPAQHFSGRGLTDRNRTLWASWAIASPGFKIFFSGDSGYFKGFEQIGRALGPFDMTFIECGAYDPAWHGVHMYPEETVRAHQDLKGRILHPVHWGTFNLALHPWYEPMVRLAAAARKAGVPIATPEPGQTITLDSLGAPWWEAPMPETKFQTATR